MSLIAIPAHPGLFQCHMDLEPVPMSGSRIARRLGWAGARPEAAREAILTVCADLRRTCRPTGGFRLLDVAAASQGFRCGGASFSCGPEIARTLDGAQRLAVFVATVGAGYERLRQAYADQAAPGLVAALDAAGTEWVERIAERIEREVRHLARLQGLAGASRVRLGSCDWPGVEQDRLIGLLPWDFCGVALQGAARLTPQKSLGGFLGLGPGAVRRAHQRVCQGRGNGRSWPDPRASH